MESQTAKLSREGRSTEQGVKNGPICAKIWLHRGSRLTKATTPHLLGPLLLRPLDRLIDLSAMDGDFLGGFDPQSHLVTPYLDHGDDDVVTDDNAFVLLSRQDEHDSASGQRSFPR